MRGARARGACGAQGACVQRSGLAEATDMRSLWQGIVSPGSGSPKELLVLNHGESPGRRGKGDVSPPRDVSPPPVHPWEAFYSPARRRAAGHPSPGRAGRRMQANDL